MITAEIRINGRMIAHVYAVNITDQLPVTTPLKGNDAYRYEVHSVDSETPTRKGNVLFLRENGALRLIQKILLTAVGEEAIPAPVKKKKRITKKKKKGKKK